MDRSAIDRLYALPLAEFTAARDALARSARKAGDRDLAAHVKGLTKPAVPAWALNQLARRDPRRFARWMASLDELRTAQIGLLSGTADAAATREAQRAEREAMVQLRQASTEVLEAHELKPNLALLERTVRTFRGAATDSEARVQLTEGRLSAEHDEPGFDALVAGYSSVTAKGSPVAAAAKATKASPSIVIAKRPKEDDRAAVETRRRAAALRERLRAAREERTVARAEAQRAAKAAGRAEQTADEAVARAAKAQADAIAAARVLQLAEEKVSALEREIP